MFQISETCVGDAYYYPLSNFLKISGSSDDKKHKGGQEGDSDVEVEFDEVDEKQ